MPVDWPLATQSGYDLWIDDILIPVMHSLAAVSGPLAFLPESSNSHYILAFVPV